MSAALLGRWVRTTCNAPTGGGAALKRENKQSWAALARAEQERAILKKATLKTELLPGNACFADLVEAQLELAAYLDCYYNTLRLHSALAYHTPHEIEQRAF
jgi:transposase InsO family protein